MKEDAWRSNMFASAALATMNADTDIVVARDTGLDVMPMSTENRAVLSPPPAPVYSQERIGDPHHMTGWLRAVSWITLGNREGRAVSVFVDSRETWTVSLLQS